MKELFELLNKYTEEKGNWSLYYNEHTSYYQTPQECYAEAIKENELDNLDLDKDIYSISWYNRTPVGSYNFYGNTLEQIYIQVKKLIKELEE